MNSNTYLHLSAPPSWATTHYIIDKNYKIIFFCNLQTVCTTNGSKGVQKKLMPTKLKLMTKKLKKTRNRHN